MKWIVGFCMAIGLSMTGTSSIRSEEPGVGKIHSILLRRQREVRNFSCEWIETHLPPSLDDGPSVVSEMDKTLIVMDDLLRYESSGKSAAYEPGELMDVSWVISFDGKKEISLHQPNERVGFPTAFLRRQKRIPNLNRTRPVLLTFRPVDPAMRGMDIRNGAIDERGGLLNGEKCTIVRLKPANGRVEEYWLSPKADYSVVRRLIKVDGLVINRIDLSVSRSNSGHWVPTSWRISKRGFERVVAGVKGVAVNDPAIKKESFRVHIPIGAVVNDQTVDPMVDYVVHRNGQHRRILPREANAGYEKWMSTATGGACPEPD